MSLHQPSLFHSEAFRVGSPRRPSLTNPTVTALGGLRLGTINQFSLSRRCQYKGVQAFSNFPFSKPWFASVTTVLNTLSTSSSVKRSEFSLLFHARDTGAFSASCTIMVQPSFQLPEFSNTQPTHPYKRL